MGLTILKLGLLSLFLGYSSTLDNGLARTPPMGWMHWERFRCIIDCNRYPDDCISEKLFMDMADRMAEDGYLEAGYEYIIVDDCWSDKKRDKDNRLQSDPYRFPSGMKALADYVHGKGLKFGIYGDYGTLTCGGYPGSLEYLKIDADTFADWGVDYVKLDGCYADPATYEEGYEEFGKYLNQTGRPMVYSCSWPAYEESEGKESNYNHASKICNLWRNYYDIDDSWASVSKITNWFADNQFRVGFNHGPGHWNDPDMLIIGNYGLSLEQSRAQMTIWIMLNAPLIMSNDLRAIRTEFKEILLNKDVLALNKDVLGKQAYRLMVKNNVNIWIRDVQTDASEEPFYAVGFVSDRTDGVAYQLEVRAQEIGLRAEYGFRVHNVWDTEQKDYNLPKDGYLKYRVPPTGAVLLIVKPLQFH